MTQLLRSASGRNSILDGLAHFFVTKPEALSGFHHGKRSTEKVMEEIARAPKHASVLTLANNRTMIQAKKTSTNNL
jgi:hypothetical protein